MTEKFRARLCLANYVLTTLASALLLFEVQPIISKFILPWFGGSPAVWTTCMVFFQTLLFAGYAYAHLSERFLSPRWQAVVHVGLLATAMWLLPIAPDASWKLDTDGAPTWRILCLLAASVGLPYFALSATGPLVQAWFCRSFPGRSPYRLYAISNFGSLLALVAYPFYVEPHFAVGWQASIWGAGFLLFAGLCATGAWSAANANRTKAKRTNFDQTISQVRASDNSQASHTTVSAWRKRLAWMALPGLASMMLLATTNHVCQDVAVMPFLWVAPLGLYLLSFIICFDHPRWYQRKFFAAAALISLLGVGAVDQLITGGADVAFSFVQEIGLHFTALFCLCMVCHGELVRLRPEPRELTSFYLLISAGGALGGGMVSLVAPLIFSTFFEWRLGLVLGCLLAAWVLVEGQQESFFCRRFALIAPALLLLFVGLSCVPQLQSSAASELPANLRNFYGVISVQERYVDDPGQRTVYFYSGRIAHGLQFVDPAKRREPTAYYGRSTGVGQLLTALADRPELRVGAVGLGVGTLATYAQAGQFYRFYELNGDVQKFAEKHFGFLGDCRGQHEVVLGDARLSLEREEPQNFDVLVLDAFSGDAIPAHLLTREAFEIYARHLRPDSIIAVHISNRYLDLSQAVAGLADELGFSSRRIISAGDASTGQFPADWILLARDPAALAAFAPPTAADTPLRKVLWTDDHSDLFGILK